MSPDELAHTIQLILAPVVMITACALTLNGVMGHYQAVSNRLRAMARERVELLRGQPDDWLVQERLSEIDTEVPDLLGRHTLIHHSLIAIEASMALLVLCMLTIALASLSGWPAFATTVLMLFLLGTLLLLVGVVFSAVDIVQSRRAVAFEAERVLHLSRKQ